MTELRVIESVSDRSRDRAIAILEAMIEQIRAEGVSQLSVYFSPLDEKSWFHDHISSDVTALVGALELAKLKVFSRSMDGE